MTLFFTDIEGSTRLLHALGPARYADALAEHRRIVREAAAVHGGVEVDTQGDAFFIAFPTPGGAAAAAETACEGARGRADPSAHGPAHGHADRDRGGLRRGGRPSRRADRRARARRSDPRSPRRRPRSSYSEPLLDLGPHRLKDFAGAVRIYQLGGREFPPLRTPGSTELPTPATHFLGREQELFDAVSLVYERDPRVLTVVGPGGTGKTRFAIELARLLGDDAEGGTVFVPLAPLRDAEFVVAAVADRLGASSPGSCGDRGARRRAPDACRLRQPRASPARRRASLWPSSWPPSPPCDCSPPAARRSGSRARPSSTCRRSCATRRWRCSASARRPCGRTSRRRTPSWSLRRLDGLPLALELAAARTKLLTPEALLDRLADRLDALKGTRDAEERHATLRATIAWSYDLLDPDEQELFASLGVFRGGCTLETAEAVCDAELDTLASLLDKSLVRRRRGRLGEERYWMLETIREFALEQLRQSGREDEPRRRHADRMLRIALDAHLGTGDAEGNIGLALAERDDLRAALDWAEANDATFGLELAVELMNFWNASSPEEGLERIQRLLDSAGAISRSCGRRRYGSAPGPPISPAVTSSPSAWPRRASTSTRNSGTKKRSGRSST